MKRSLQSSASRGSSLFVASGVALIGTTYGLARLGYGLFLPAFSDSFALAPGVSGLLSTGASLMYCLAAIVGFRHATSRPRAVTLLAGVSAAAGSAGIAAAGSAGAFAAAVLLAGMGAGFASPALVELVRRTLAPPRAGRAQSVVNSGTGFGVVLAGLLSLVLGDAWRTAWIGIAVIAVVSTLGVLLTARGEPTPPSTPRRPSRLARSSVQGLGRPVTGALVFGVGSAAVWVYGRTVLETTGGMTPAESAGAWVALGAGGAGAVLTARWLAARPVAVTWSASVIATGAATALIIVAPGSPGTAYAATAVFGLAYTAASSVLIMWASNVADDGAAGTAVLFVALVLGQAAGATSTGWLIEFAGPAPAFIAAAVVCCAAAAAGVSPGVRRPTTAGPAHPRGWR